MLDIEIRPELRLIELDLIATSRSVEVGYISDWVDRVLSSASELCVNLVGIAGRSKQDEIRWIELHPIATS
jgi:hypothetical protein